MKREIKLALLGGDARQGYLAAALAARGYECAVWGLGKDVGIGTAVRCRDWKDSVRGANAVILPLPASLDGFNINCQNGNENDKLKINALLGFAEVPVYGGRFDESALAFASSHQKRLIDYFDSESLRIRNAEPTAEGAVSIAMQKMSRTVSGCRAAVVGYGRIGKMLAHLLARIGAEVTVAARNGGQLAEAASFGYRTLRISENAPYRGLEKLLDREGCDVIFNTAPARLFDEEVIRRMDKEILIIDLASVPGGVDFAAAKDKGIEAVWALSLPGKYAPESAGAIIADVLDELFESEGII